MCTVSLMSIESLFCILFYYVNSLFLYFPYLQAHCASLSSPDCSHFVFCYLIRLFLYLVVGIAPFCYLNSLFLYLVVGMAPFCFIMRTASLMCFGCTGPVSCRFSITSIAAKHTLQHSYFTCASNKKTPRTNE